MEDTRPTTLLYYFRCGGGLLKSCAVIPLVQYRLRIKYVWEISNFISNINDLDIAQNAAAHDGLIFVTMIDNEMAAYSWTLFNKHQLTYYSTHSAHCGRIGCHQHMKPNRIIGAQHELSIATSTRSGHGILYVFDDEVQGPKGFEEADIILL